MEGSDLGPAASMQRVAEALQVNGTLQSLDLGRTALRATAPSSAGGGGAADGGVAPAAILEAVSTGGNTSLMHLSLRGHSLAAPQCLLPLAELLCPPPPCRPSLTSLDLTSCALGDAHVAALFQVGGPVGMIPAEVSELGDASLSFHCFTRLNS